MESPDHRSSLDGSRPPSLDGRPRTTTASPLMQSSVSSGSGATTPTRAAASPVATVDSGASNRNFMSVGEPIKFGDLLFFYSDVFDSYMFGDGVKGRCIGRPATAETEALLLTGLFRVHPKFDYSAKKDLSNAEKVVLQKDQKEAIEHQKEQKKRLQENAKQEIKQNEREDRQLAGKPVFYGQIVELVHFDSNTILAGNKNAPAEYDPACLKLELVDLKDSSASCWFKVMPRYKVRFEGEKIRRGDQVVLINVKTGLFVHTDVPAEEGGISEINLYSKLTSWNIYHYAPFIQDSEKFVKGGDVVRLYHQEAEGFVRAEFKALYDIKQHQVYVKLRNGRTGDTSSSNAMFQIDLPAMRGGIISWSTEIKLKHMGTGKYLSYSKVSFDDKHPEKLPLILTKDTLNPDTTFMLHPVDKGDDAISYGVYFRIQHKTSGRWLHIGNWINDPKLKENKDVYSIKFAKKKIMELSLSTKFHYEDALTMRLVNQKYVDELNYVNGLYAVLKDFLRVVKEKPSENPQPAAPKKEFAFKRKTDAKRKAQKMLFKKILELHTDPAIKVMKKLITFCNISSESNPLLQDGIPIVDHQKLLFEQQFLEVCWDILLFQFGGTPQLWNEQPKQMKENFLHYLSKESNAHILSLFEFIYKFFQIMVKDNEKIGVFMAQWQPVFLLHLSKDGLGVSGTMIELVKDNYELLSQLPNKHMDAIIKLLKESRNAKSLAFLSAVCTCDDLPVFKNQNYVLDQVLKNIDLIIKTYTQDGRISVEIAPGQWIAMETFLRLEEVNPHNSTMDPFKYPYNPHYKAEIDYFKEQLRLLYKISQANKKCISMVTDGVPDKGIAPLLSEDQVLIAVRDAALPGSFRADYCDLLYLWIDNDMPSKPQVGIKLTWSWLELTKDFEYEHKLKVTIGELGEGKSIQDLEQETPWVQQNVQILQEFLLGQMANGHKIPYQDVENNDFLLSVLGLFEKMVDYGFFIGSKESNRIVSLLFGLLDGRTEKVANKYKMNELNLLRMKIKLRVCEILHRFYDMKAEQRVAEELYKFKQSYLGEFPHADDDLLAASPDEPKKSNKKRRHKESDNGIELVQLREVKETPDFEIIEILLDTTLYEYAPLTTASLKLLFRHMRPFVEVITVLEDVQLLMDAKSVTIYQAISDGVGRLQTILKDNDISVEDAPEVIRILKQFVELCCYKGDMNVADSRNQTIFRNLKVHNTIFRVLRLPYRSEYHYIFKMCYLFLTQFVQNNKTNQSLIFIHLEFILSQMGYKLNIADCILSILNDNYALCSEVDYSFIAHLVKLISKRGRKRKYLQLLSMVVEAEGHTIQANQNSVAQLLFKKQDKTLLLLNQLPALSVGISPHSSSKDEDYSQALDQGADIDFDTQGSGKVNSLRAFLGDPTKKLTVAAFEAQEKARIRNDEAEDLLYHVGMVEALARCCRGKNHMPEMLAQSVISPEDCYDVIMEPNADIMIKAAYTRFISEVWLYTARSTELWEEDLMWEVLKQFTVEIRGFAKSRHRKSKLNEESALTLADLGEDDYIFKSVVPFLECFFTHKFTKNELSDERIRVANFALDELCALLKAFRGNESKFILIANSIEKIKSAKLPGFDKTTGGKDIEEILMKAKARLVALHGVDTSKAKTKAFEEMKKLKHLREYTEAMYERKSRKKSKRTIVDKELERVVKIFNDRLELEKEPEKKGKGTRYTENLINQMKSSKYTDAEVQYNCLEIVIQMIKLSEKEDEDDSSDDDDEELRANRNQTVSFTELSRKVQVQNKLGSLNALVAVIDLFLSPDPDVVSYALQLAYSLLDGGNTKLQRSMMQFFLSTPDPQFFDDIRRRITFAVEDLKARRRKLVQIEKRQRLIATGDMDLDDPELKNNTIDDMTNLLKFLQNLCEGHFTDMKDYLRKQYDNTVSINLVKEITVFAVELERAFKSTYSKQEPMTLAIQYFRTLTELSSGCPKNQLAITSGKITGPINDLLSKLASRTASTGRTSVDELILKKSMLELLHTLVEGHYPELEKETSSVPPALLSVIRFSLLRETTEQAIHFISTIVDEDKQLKRETKANNKGEVYTWVAKDETEFDLAREVASKGVIVLKILNEFDPRKKTEIDAILNGPVILNFSTKNIGSIEIINSSGDLERVYFAIPGICHNLKKKTKEELMRDVSRDTPTDKIEDFVQRSDVLKYEINHQTKILESRFSWVVRTPFWFPNWRNILTIISIVQNALMLGSYVEVPESDLPVLEGTITRGIDMNAILTILGVMHFFFSVIWSINFLVDRAPVIIYQKKEAKKKKVEEKNELLARLGRQGQVLNYIPFFSSLKIFLMSGEFIYNMLYMILSFVGLFFPPAFAFHMLDISFRSPSVRNVLRAVTLNGTTILLTGLLVLFVVYIYAFFGFFFFRSNYANEALDCYSLMNCLLTTLDEGIRSGGGIGEVLEQRRWTDTNFSARLIFDMTFFVIIIVILLNIVFGIILDTFGELRDQKNFIEEDIRTRCFICSLDGGLFQRKKKALGFRHHIKHDHNMWHYLYFFIYLEQKDPTEYTYAEEYIASKIDSDEVDYFPISKAIVVENFDANEDLRPMVAYLYKKSKDTEGVDSTKASMAHRK